MQLLNSVILIKTKVIITLGDFGYPI